MKQTETPHIVGRMKDPKINACLMDNLKSSMYKTLIHFEPSLIGVTEGSLGPTFLQKNANLDSIEASQSNSSFCSLFLFLSMYWTKNTKSVIVRPGNSDVQFLDGVSFFFPMIEFIVLGLELEITGRIRYLPDIPEDIPENAMYVSFNNGRNLQEEDVAIIRPSFAMFSLLVDDKAPFAFFCGELWKSPFSTARKLTLRLVTCNIDSKGYYNTDNIRRDYSYHSHVICEQTAFVNPFTSLDEPISFYVGDKRHLALNNYHNMFIMYSVVKYCNRFNIKNYVGVFGRMMQKLLNL